jgi:hypothetical protein
MQERVDQPTTGDFGVPVTVLSWIALLEFAGLVLLARRVRRDQAALSWLASGAHGR